MTVTTKCRDGDFAGGLLSRVITGAPAPVLAVHEDYANGTSADFVPQSLSVKAH